MAFKIERPRKQRPYGPQEMKYISELAGTMEAGEIAKLVNAKFGNKRTANGIIARGNKNGIMFGMKKAS